MSLKSIVQNFRPTLGSKTTSILTALYLLAFLNITFWKKIHEYLWAYPITIGALYIGIFALFTALLVSVSVKYIQKPILALFIVSASAASWFMDRFGAIVDKDMIRNAFETTPAEANGLITKGLLLHLFLTALIPIALLFWVKIRHQSFLRKVAGNCAVIFSCLLLVAAIGLTNSKAVASAVRQHKDIVKTLNPVTPIISTVAFFVQENQTGNLTVAPLGLDAKLQDPAPQNTKPRVTIIVAGETARAQSFSLNGYEKQTNPELSKRDVIYFPNTESCGTATATSLPCMFSNFTRKEFSHQKGLENENLVDVLTHAGVNVSWLDNDTGSKGVATRIPYRDLSNSNDPNLCEEGECRDAIFLPEVTKWLDSITKDSVLVIHQIGSHGPAYYKRYSEEERLFKPDCRTADLGNCSTEEIQNAYDNTIVATDHFVAQLIDMLTERQQSITPALLYISDHGESLGENGLYLHGTPYIFAPYEQTHVPMLLWMDSEFATSMQLDKSCLQRSASEGGKSHDNIFHSVLTMMNVTTDVHDPKLDIFNACKMVTS